MSGFLKKLTACGAILCALSPLFAVRRAKAEILMTPPSVCRGQVNDPVLGWLRVTLYDDGSVRRFRNRKKAKSRLFEK
jgi:hypothetical protein